MPPARRSTRSSRASEEPSIQEKPAHVTKRKRSSAVSEDTDIKEQENVRKPSSRTTRRSSSANPSAPATGRTRSSSRPSSTLEQVEESDDDDVEEIQPPSKKSRPSTDLDEEEDVKPQVRSRRSAPAKPVPVSRKGKAASPPREVIVIDDSDDEPPQQAIVKPPARKTSARKPSVQPKVAPASRSNTGRGSRDASKIVKAAPEEDDDDDDDDNEVVEVKPAISDEQEEEEEEVVKSSKGRKAPPKRSSRRTVQSTGSVPESEQEATSEAEEDVRPAVRRGKQKAAPQTEPSGSGRSRGQYFVKEEPAPAPAPEAEMFLDSDAEVEQLALPPSPPKDSSPRTPRKERPETPPYEEEKSLLDMLPPSPTKARLQPEEPQRPKPRLVIHKMALINFKSYAGRQEIGPFHKSFSAIVGPNGSGKSNTIDALLFVFGYRAAKMRQAKLSELIHNSAQYPDLDDCSVEVHFREIMDLPGPDEYTVIPDSTLVVARTAYKNNSSKYTINGKQSNYKEVQTLLKGRGIDLDHNRFLILQGEVESIAQMKAKAANEHDEGLLEYLEDIIGTSQYKVPIDESAVEIERINEERQEKISRLKIVERDKNALEAKKREAEDYLRLKNEHVRAQSTLWQYYIWKCFDADKAFRKTLLKLEKDLADERERNKDDVALLEELEQHYQSRVKTYEEVKTAAARAVKDMAASEKEEVGLEEKRKHASTKAKKLKKSLHEDENARDEALRAIEENSTKMESEKRKADTLEETLQREEKVLEGIRDSLKDKTQVFHDQIETKQKELQPWTAKINTKQAEVDVKSSERDALAKKAELINAASQEASESFGQLQSEQESKLGDLADLKKRKQSLQQEVKTGESKVKTLQARVQELRAKASSSRQRVDEAKASQAASTSQNRVLDCLKGLKSQGRVDGFHGRLGELGTIDDKYDVAISTACGALYNMVVDTVEQGQTCIKYLRTQNVGRSNFMVLDKLRQSNGMAPIQTPEGVPRLFDLIKLKEPRFAAAFYKGVGDTLVTNDLNQANRIAFGGAKRWRVVTLAGQLIDSSGTMSGGGNHVARGGMSSKLAADAVSPDVLRKYEHDSEAAVRELEAATGELRQAENAYDALIRSGPQIDLAIEKANMDVQNGTKRIAEAEKRVRDLKAQSKPDSGDLARISVLEREIASAQGDLKQLQERSSSIEGDIKALEKKILEIGGARLLTQKSKVDGLKLHINIANDEITKAEVAKAKAEKDSVKLESAVETHSAGLKESEDELAQLTEQLKSTSEFVAQLRSEVEAAQIAVENSKDDLDALKTELDEKTEGIQEFKKKEMELTQKLEDTQKEADANTQSLDHYQAEHDMLKLEEIDEDDEDDGDEEDTKPDPTTDGEVDPIEAGPGEAGPSRVKREPGEDGVGKKKGRQQGSSSDLHMYSTVELAKFKRGELIADEQLLDERLKAAKADLGVLKEYKKREEEWQARVKDLDDTTALRDAEKAKHDGLRKQRLDEFMAGFNLISLKLKEMYQMITLGGNAELELVDSMDPFSEGIIFSVMPPKKSWRNISNLSGGEKTLSSLALVFALHVFKPTPLYFMDEIDAALDFRNVSIVANYIKDRTKNAQFIIISLRNDMFELSHRLIGIYKTSNQTRSISIDNRALQAPVGATAQASQ